MSSRSYPEPTWTLAEAASWLDPQITEHELRCLVTAARLQPSPPARILGRPRGRPASRYPLRELQSLHAVITPWLERSPRQ